VQLILNSHEHFDHAGGMAALQRYSGAGVVVSEAALEAFHTGQVSAIDPQAGYAPENGFPPIPTATALAGGETLELGGNRFTLNPTPGHAPGSTSWSWEACEDSSCLTVLYADSMSAVAAPGFQFSQALEGLHGATTADQLRDSISFLRGFDCDILLSPHTMYFGMEEKLEARANGATDNPFHAPADCAQLADRLEKALDKRLEQEQAATP
jgi:metallo-beta-lactamase class B